MLESSEVLGSHSGFDDDRLVRRWLSPGIAHLLHGAVGPSMKPLGFPVTWIIQLVRRRPVGSTTAEPWGGTCPPWDPRPPPPNRGLWAPLGQTVPSSEVLGSTILKAIRTSEILLTTPIKQHLGSKLKNMYFTRGAQALQSFPSVPSFSFDFLIFWGA